MGDISVGVGVKPWSAVITPRTPLVTAFDDNTVQSWVNVRSLSLESGPACQVFFVNNKDELFLAATLSPETPFYPSRICLGSSDSSLVVVPVGAGNSVVAAVGTYHAEPTMNHPLCRNLAFRAAFAADAMDKEGADGAGDSGSDSDDDEEDDDDEDDFVPDGLLSPTCTTKPDRTPLPPSVPPKPLTPISRITQGKPTKGLVKSPAKGGAGTAAGSPTGSEKKGVTFRNPVVASAQDAPAPLGEAIPLHPDDMESDDDDDVDGGDSSSSGSEDADEFAAGDVKVTVDHDGEASTDSDGDSLDDDEEDDDVSSMASDELDATGHVMGLAEAAAARDKKLAVLLKAVYKANPNTAQHVEAIKQFQQRLAEVHAEGVLDDLSSFEAPAGTAAAAAATPAAAEAKPAAAAKVERLADKTPLPGAPVKRGPVHRPALIRPPTKRMQR